MRARDWQHVGGAKISVFTSDFGGGCKQMQLQMRGQDVAALNAGGRQVKAERREDARRGGHRALDARDRSRSSRSTSNRGLAGTLGLTVGQVAQSLRPAFAGIDAGDWVDPSGETRDVTVRLTPESRQRASDLRAAAAGGAGPERRADARCRSARWRRSSRASARRSSTTSIAIRWSTWSGTRRGAPPGEVMTDVQARARPRCSCRRACATRGRRRRAAGRGVRQDLLGARASRCC